MPQLQDILKFIEFCIQNSWKMHYDHMITYIVKYALFKYSMDQQLHVKMNFQ